MGAVDMKNFLQHYLHTTEGKVLDTSGEEIGVHDGALLYTIGQRHGFRTTKHSTHEAPLYVIAKDIEKNTITVSTSGTAEIRQSDDITVLNLNDTSGQLDRDEWPPSLVARIRHRGERYPVQLVQHEPLIVNIEQKRAREELASGQSIVFYDGAVCLGGGVMSL
jgi:tRNA-specific 2-thiouridylase